jgi:putative transposase
LIPQRVHNFGTYFVTTQTWGRRSLFQVDELARLFLQTLYHYRYEGKYLIHSFVVMPNHVHLVITPPEITLERAMQLIKGGFSHGVCLTGRKNLMIWQKGFTDHRIRDAEDFQRHREYIHFNPVRARLCEKPEQYAYSSAAGAYNLGEVPQRLKPLSLPAVVRHA